MSLFHTELLQFLLESGRKQMEKQGIDGPSNPHFLALLKDLSSDFTKEPVPMSEIIEHYHHLFDLQPNLPLEKFLIEAFPQKDFSTLGLGRYYPKIYRGLPRVYLRQEPSQIRIKKNFSHLPTLKKQALTRSLFSLYQSFLPEGKVALFTWMINDGLGDLIAVAEIFHLFKARFPRLELFLVILAEEKTIPYLPLYLALPEQTMLISYEKESPLSRIPLEALEILGGADLVLQVPTYYPHTKELLQELQKYNPEIKFEGVGEYGFAESDWFHPESGCYSLGLHFLENGVLIRKGCKSDWSQVENEEVRNWRRGEHHFYLAYLTSPIGGAIYLHALLKSLEGDRAGIDLCVPDLGWFFEFSDKQKRAGRPLLEWDMGVASIEIRYKEHVHTIPIAREGKKVRLLCPGILSSADFRSLLSLSGDWVAVRGDQSFSEAVSQNKPFFFDGREHARYFIKDLSALAKNRLSDYPAVSECISGMVQALVYQLPLEEGDWVEETFFQELEDWTSIALKIGLSLQDPQTVLGYQKLNQIIKEEKSANSFLCHLIQRGICQARHPEIASFEKEKVNQFISGSLSFADLIRSIKDFLEESRGDIAHWKEGG